jgi:hypothetical protein
VLGHSSCTLLQTSLQNAVNVGPRLAKTSYMPALPGQLANLAQLAFASSAIVRLKVRATMSQTCAIPPFSTNPRTKAHWRASVPATRQQILPTGAMQQSQFSLAPPARVPQRMT